MAASKPAATPTSLTADELRKIDAYWRAANYLCVGMLYLQDNPLLREPLNHEHVKTRLLGHWGSDPGQTFVWVHLNRLIRKYDLNMIYMSGPGHGAPATLANSYLEGMYSEVYPDSCEDEEGMQRFFRQFSFPGGIGSHCTPETPGSIHEGGELGYSLSHGFGAAFDNPDLIVTVVVGDGEAETGPLATSWHSNKFLNPIRDGAVLPILHLNGYKIANPTILARIPADELQSLLAGYGYTPHFVEGDDPAQMHQKMAATLEECIAQIRSIQDDARRTGKAVRPRWPMIVLRTPKGWTGPTEVDGHKVEDFWRAHQMPIPEVKTNPAHLRLLESWMRSYKPEELFSARGQAGPRTARTRAAGASPDERQPACQWRHIARAAADAGLSRLRGGNTQAREEPGQEHFCPRPVPARRHAREHGQFPDVRSRRNRVQPPAGDLRGDSQDLAGRDQARGQRRRPALSRRPRDGDAQRTHPGRLAGRLPADRPPWLVLHLRGVRPRHRFDVQSARQVAGEVQDRKSAGALRSRRSTC